MVLTIVACIPMFASFLDLQDFSAKWLDAVKGKTKDPVCVRVYEEAEGIRKAVPALKFARGEPFKEDHWSQVRLLLPRDGAIRSLPHALVPWPSAPCHTAPFA